MELRPYRTIQHSPKKLTIGVDWSYSPCPAHGLRNTNLKVAVCCMHREKTQEHYD